MADDEAEVPLVPDTAAALRDVTSELSTAPVPTYVVPADADALLKQFLAEINDVARESEVVRCDCLGWF